MHDEREGNINRAKVTDAPRTQAQGAAMMGGACAGRQSSKSLLLEHAEQLRRKANQLESLAYAIEYISGDAEGTLYGLLSGDIHRR